MRGYFPFWSKVCSPQAPQIKLGLTLLILEGAAVKAVHTEMIYQILLVKQKYSQLPEQTVNAGLELFEN